jgi:hypothetical protein
MTMNRQEAQAEIRRVGDAIAALRAKLAITADQRERDELERAIRLNEREQHTLWTIAYR